jgi:phosphate transport system protein
MRVRTQYRYKLDELQRALLQLSDEVERAIGCVIGVLQRNDISGAQRAIRDNQEIGRRHAEVEGQVLNLIATEQPTSTDLRFLLAVLHISQELERIGDYVRGIAVLVERDQDQPTMAQPAELRELDARVRHMLKQSVRAFIEREAGAGVRLHREDDHADELYRKLYDAMIAHVQDAPREAQRALHLLFVGHNLERIADRAVNIAERASFIATGQGKEVRA